MDESDLDDDAPDGGGGSSFRRSVTDLIRRLSNLLPDDDPTTEELRLHLDANPDSAPPARLVSELFGRLGESPSTTLSSAGISGLDALSAWISCGSGNGDGNGEPVAEPLCVGFTDIVAFTEYTETNGDERALELLGRHNALVEPPLAAHGGTVVKRLGDGLMITFSDGTAGVTALLDAFDALKADRAKASDPIRIRAGLTVGKPISVGNDLLGSDVNLAARVTDAAKADQILVTLALVESTGSIPGVEFGRSHNYRLKGFPKRVPLVRATRSERSATP